ncbi:MAG: ATP-binding protein [Candidatus Cryptobacteroides sp.]
MNTENIIGRQEELATLERLYNSDKSEFLAIYGRRRVGKSYLVDEAFRGEIAFSAVGIFSTSPEASRRKIQLRHFYNNLLEYGLNPSYKEPDDWMEAFSLLRNLLSRNNSRRIVIFLDELPWMAGPQSSELVEELGFFWNNWAVKQRNILLIVCGSATSWMLDNIIRDYGGLHSRLTEKMFLSPFTLGESREYYKRRGFLMSDYEIALCQMAIGGIPYYMDRMSPDRTLTQNINNFYFENKSIDQEFTDVYAGLFQSATRYIDVVSALGRKFYGMTRNEILAATKISGGGTFTKIIDNLKECGIIRIYPRYGKGRKETVYQLCDYFTLFYLNFVKNSHSSRDWGSFQRSHEYESWSGRTFELLCSQHIRQIKKALMVKFADKEYCWSGATPEGQGVQIDMIIPSPNERTDYICEMKFSESKYLISGSYEEDIFRKINAFRSSSRHKASHSLLFVMITSLGLVESVHNRAVNIRLSLDDLFSL